MKFEFQVQEKGHKYTFGEDKIMKFEFQEKGHKYTLDGKPLTGVTTILGVIAKPQLISWASRMATEFIAQAIKDGKEITPELLEEAKNAHRTKKEEAGGLGTSCHLWLEQWIKAEIKRTQSNEKVI